MKSIHLDTPIEEFFKLVPKQYKATCGFRKACKFLKCKTVRDIVKHPVQHFEIQFGIGAGTIKYINQTLADFGLHLKDEIVPRTHSESGIANKLDSIAKGLFAIADALNHMRG